MILELQICEEIQKGLTRIFELCQKSIKDNGGHPWEYMESRINTIANDEICPILSLQSDYENLSDCLKERINQLSLIEIDLLKQLVKDYNAGYKEDEIVISTFMSIKGALQYRRILGEKFFLDSIEVIKKQFYRELKREDRK